MGFVVAIDGPAGAGKSTVARMLARSLGWRFLDTGAIYRAVTLASHEVGIPPHDGAALAALARRVRLRQDADGRMFLDERDVSQDIRSETVTAAVSAVSAHPEVREALIGAQRRAAADADLVCEGRDMGTVVFPSADVKLYLDADVPTRARRRSQDLARAGAPVPLAELEQRIAERDAKDASRAASPLARTKDQIYIDTSALDLDEVVARVKSVVAERLRRRDAGA